jgi:hypothetical protein
MFLLHEPISATYFSAKERGILGARELFIDYGSRHREVRSSIYTDGGGREIGARNYLTIRSAKNTPPTISVVQGG